MIDSGRPSLFVVQSPMDLRSRHFCSILQLQSNDPRASAAPELPVRLDKKKDSLVHFTNDFDLNPDPVPPPMTWMCSSTKDELFMVPFLTSDAYQLDVPPLYGLEYNFRTHTYRQMDPPVSLKPYAGCAVNLAGLLYFIAQPYAPFDLQAKPCIQRYDPLRRLWKTLAPFPMPSNTDIKATAVWYDNILFNMVGRRPEMWAFNVRLNKWYPVIVQDEDNLCYHIVGEAVVLENTIYSLKDDPCNSVLALSIQRVENNGRILFTCSLLCEIPVLGMKSISSLCGRATREIRYLVHLGQGNFCLVQGCSPAVTQPVQVTYMKLEGNNSMVVTDNCVYEFPIEDGLQFHVLSCFSIPEYKTLPAEDQGEEFLFSPFPDDYEPWEFDISIFKFLNAQSGVPSRNNPLLKQTNIIDEQDFEQGVSKTRDPTDTWSPEIHPQHVVPKKSSASLRAAKFSIAFKKSSISFCTKCCRGRRRYVFRGRRYYVFRGQAKLAFAPKASTLGIGHLTSKKINTVGEDFERGGSKSVVTSATDTSPPEIHLQEHLKGAKLLEKDLNIRSLIG